VWNELANNDGATGGGVSNQFPLPTWQANANVPAPTGSSGGRGVPDVSGNADPNTGYTIRVDGETSVIGGTSAVAPLWAGLIAVANQQLGTKVGFIQPAIYAAKAAAAFNDITEGNNPAFSAGPGWDACTGLGSPKASALIPLLAPAGVIPTPAPPPTPTQPPPKKKKKKKKAAKAAPVDKKASKKVSGKKAGKKASGKRAGKKTSGKKVGKKVSGKKSNKKKSGKKESKKSSGKKKRKK
jgi:kumamolisin